MQKKRVKTTTIQNLTLESVSNEIRVVAFVCTTVGTRFIFTKKSNIAIITDVSRNLNIKENVYYIHKANNKKY